MNGKSQAATIITKTKCELDPSTRIGVTCKSVYKRLVEQGVPEENLIKCWERKEEPLEIIWDECYDLYKL